MSLSSAGRVAGLLALLFASRSQAFDPWQAAQAAKQLGRPTTSMLSLDAAALRHPQLSPVASRLFAPGAAPLGVFLNRHATRYTCGDDNAVQNVSSVVCEAGSASTVGGFSYSDASWSEVVSCVGELFAPFNLYVSDTEPTSGDYVEAMVGGSPAQAGMPNGVGGVSPFTCNMIPGAVVYAFADVYGDDSRGICETVAQEVAHAFGLDHELLCADPMTYLTGCGEKTFQDVYASCGEFEPRECSCGIASQNSVQMMFERLGAADGSPPPPPVADNAPPTAALVSPADGDTLLANTTIAITAEVADDSGLSIVELEWDFTDETMFCPGASGAYECTLADGVATWTIGVGTGVRTYRLHVRDLVGNDVTTADRTIHLTADGLPPPNDPTPPTVALLSPRPGAVAAANTTLRVQGYAHDNDALASVELVWPYRDERYACPIATDGVSCTQDGDIFTWTLSVGAGERNFRIRATDRAGNMVESDEAYINLVDGAAVNDDGNNLPSDAVSLGCGDSAELLGNDVDWISVNGDGAITVTTSGAEARLLVPSTEASPSDDVELQDADHVNVAVLPNSAGLGPVTVQVSCEPTAASGSKKHTAAGCAHTGPATWLPLLGLALLRKRRSPVDGQRSHS